MKRLPKTRAGAALTACAAVVTALAAVGPAAASSSEAKVAILDSGFRPAVVRIKQWNVVAWVNDGKAKHGVASDTGSTLESGALDPGQGYGNLFTKAGTVTYHDSEHPSLKGRVIVIAAPKPKATGPKHPTGKRPKHFRAQGTITATSAPTPGSGGGTNWTAIGAGLGGAVLALLALAFVMLRRRGSSG